MGLFSSKTVWQHAAGAAEILGDEPERLPKALMSALVNESRVSHELVDEFLNGKGNIFSAIKHYSNTSTLQLPRTTVVDFTGTNTDQLQAILRTELGHADLVVTKAEIDLDNSEHHLNYALHTQYGYKPSKKTFTVRSEADTALLETVAETEITANLLPQAMAQLTEIYAALPTETPVSQTVVTEGTTTRVFNAWQVYTYGDPVVEPPTHTSKVLSDMLVEAVPYVPDEETNRSIVGYTVSRTVMQAVQINVLASAEQTITWYKQEISPTTGNPIGEVKTLSTATKTLKRLGQAYSEISTPLAEFDVPVEYPRADLFIYAEARYSTTDTVTDPETEEIKTTTTFHDYVLLFNATQNEFPAATQYIEASLTNPLYPIIPLRVDNDDPVATNMFTAEERDDIDQIFHWCGFKYEKLLEELNKNPDIGQIDNAAMMFGVQLGSSNQGALRYMAEFFEYMDDTINAEPVVQVPPYPPTPVGYSSEISDEEMNAWAEEQHQANLAQAEQDALIAARKAGQKALADMKYAIPQKLYSIRWDIPQWFNKNFPFEQQLSWGSITRYYYLGNIGPRGTVVRSHSDDYVRFQVQVTAKVYKEITVYGLTYAVVIRRWGNQSFTDAYNNNQHIQVTSIGAALGLESRRGGGLQSIFRSGDTTYEDDPDGIVIPLYHPVVESMSMLDRNSLYYSSLQLITTSIDKQKVKWYQKSWLRNLIKIVAFVVGVLGFIDMSVQLMAVAAGTAALSTVLYVLIKKLVIKFLIAEAIKATVKILGLEKSLLIAVLTAAYLGSETIMQGWEYLESSVADTLLKATALIANGIASNVQDEIMALQNDIMDFNTTVEDSLAALETAQAELDTNLMLDPLAMITRTTTSNMRLTETPDQFYYRACHAGNTGPLAYDAIERYVELALTPPAPEFSYQA